MTSKVLYGVDNVINKELEFFSKTKIRIDTCMNYTRPPLALGLEPIRNAFVDAKSRGVKLRYLTQVTPDNISYCKDLMTIVDELRHLDGIKGNFMVSETEYLAPIVLFEKGKVASEIISINVKEIVDQHQYMFDTLWSKAMSAQQRIREIEGGAIISHETKMLEEYEEKINKFKEYIENSNRLSVCTEANRMQFVYNNFFGIIEKILDKSKNGEHKGIRWLTSITNKHSVNLVKKFLDREGEAGGIAIRHINQIPMSFGVSDKEIVGSIVNTKGTEMAKSLFISNEPQYVKHFATIFEELWKNGIDASVRIKNIKEGIPPIRTKIVNSQDEIINEIKGVNNNADKLSICTGFGGMQMSYNYFFDSYKKIIDKHQKQEEGDGLRFITNIDKESLNLVKIFLDSGIQIRHIKNMPPMSFGVSDKEVAITIEKMEGGKMSQSFLISNEPLYVNHFDSIFEELWKNGIDAIERIRDIDAGLDLSDIEAIPSSERAQDLYLDIVKSAAGEILWIFPTTNAFIRQEKMGAVPLGIQAAKERNVKVRILVPANNLIEQKVQQLKQYFSDQRETKIIDVRYIEQMSETKATILVVDRKVSLVMELRDDSKTTFLEAIGNSTYSNSKSGVLSYVAIFENLWRQTELYQELMKAHEQLKDRSKMQKDFINIAAHEMRTPIQPVLGLAEILSSKIKDPEQLELLDVIIRNAKRSQKLTNEILDVTKIENQSLELKKQLFNLNDVIINTINDVMANRQYFKKSDEKNQIKLSYEPQDVVVAADKARITEVISNLLINAVKFTKEGAISISIVKKGKDNNNNNNNNKQEEVEEVTISVKDEGVGIDPQILPRLFTKFATKSETEGGTGLGLYISKSIVESHGGRIWAANNKDGKGATFTFSLPIIYTQVD